MKNSKLISLLKTFSSKEWKAFDKYLQSPYLNANKRLIHFYGILRKCRPSFNPIKLAKPKIFAALFPNKEKYDDPLLRATMADLHKTAESFLVYEKLKQDDRTHRKLLIRSYGERELYYRFERQTETLLEKIKEQTINGIGDYLDAFLLNKDHYFHPRTEALDTSAVSLKNAAQYLDQFYSLAKLRLSCELSARSKIVVGETEYPMLEAVRHHIENNLLDKDPAFGIYLDLLKINLEGLTKELFFALKNKYLAAQHKLSYLEQKEILIYLINYSYRLVLGGDRSFFYEQFELYKIGLKNNLLLDGKLLPDIRFTNIAVIGSTIKEWEWATDFIQTYSSMLSADIAEDAIYLAKAYMHFHKGDFLETDKLVNQISSNKIDYKFRQYSLSIRSLFEITLAHSDYSELLNSRIYAYEKYLSRQKIFSKKRILAEYNFTKIIKKMSAILSDNKHSKTQWEELKKETENINPIAAKKWLLTKLSKNMK